MKVIFSVGTGIVGSYRSTSMELPLDMPDDKIEELFVEWVWETIDAEWKKSEA